MAYPIKPAGGGYVSPYPPLSTAARAPTIVAAVGAATSAASPPTSSSSSSPLIPHSLHSATTASEAQSASSQKQVLIDALNEHRLNTIGELRRVERLFASLGSPDLTQPMTAAWMYYVDSNSLLAEIRTLTRNYPFSSECLSEAKRRVYQDPASNRSWNLAWLVLAKVHTDQLIPTYARIQASQPEMWGGTRPTQRNIDQLTTAFEKEWSSALAQLLRYWEAPPVKPSSASGR